MFITNLFFHFLHMKKKFNVQCIEEEWYLQSCFTGTCSLHTFIILIFSKDKNVYNKRFRIEKSVLT